MVDKGWLLQIRVSKVVRLISEEVLFQLWKYLYKWKFPL